MSKEHKKHNTQKKILIAIAIMLIAIVPLCFLYSLVVLIIEPSNAFVVENREDI